MYYIDVCPKLVLQRSLLPLDALSIFSVISKFMGKFPSDWEKHFHGIGQRGYNMVHFTPLVIRGDSNSPYSISDQLQFDRASFPQGETDVTAMVKKMENDFGLLSLTDVVWNHTAPESKWLQEHPEAGYNLQTAPWLESALELDDALLQFSLDLSKLGLPNVLINVDDLHQVLNGVKSYVLQKIQLWQYYVIDVVANLEAIIEFWKRGQIDFPNSGFGNQGVNTTDEVKNWSLKQRADWIIANALSGNDRMGERFRRKVDPKKAAGLLSALFGRYDPYKQDVTKAREAASQILDECNLQFYREYDADVSVIIEQMFNQVKYARIDEHGPKLGIISKGSPLVKSYFTRLPINEVTRKHDPRALALVNNGWIWAADAMRDNAGPQSRAYLRREVIEWGDCVKLRYGSGPEDSPYLWEHMTAYTRLMAKCFVGFRIDNCHSTPIHLAEYMLDEARKVRPNLVVIAELFTGSEEMDFRFVERLGISCLIREAMQSWGTQEMSRIVHRNAGVPIGSFELDYVSRSAVLRKQTMTDGINGNHEVGRQENLRRIRRSPVHALFMDCTHDNEVPAQKRDARDTLPNAALVAMCASAVGSVMGYDEIYPRLIELVHEKRLYSSPSSSNQTITAGAGEGGIAGVKKILNQIHTLMGKNFYDETYIHHDREYITIHRVHPKSRRGYFLIAHTAYPGCGTDNGGFPPVDLPGTRASLIGAYALEVDTSWETVKRVIDDKTTLKGLPSHTRNISSIGIENRKESTIISIPADFPPGSIALFETWVPAAEYSEGLDNFITSNAQEAMQTVNLLQLNLVLYRCDPEERDMSDNQDGTYSIPGFGPLVYAGLQGWWSVLKDVIHNNDLGHSLCQHLREGTWAMDYCVKRLDRASRIQKYEELAKISAWLQKRFDAIRKLPSFLYPRYFALIIRTAYSAAYSRGLELMGDNVQRGRPFLKRLAMVSAQVTGYMNSASLVPERCVASLAAGLPHFSSSWARCWGRDIFISLRGLYLGTGRFDDAREHILAFASVLKHGMIPNLLGDGKTPRYNSRDSVWFFLQNIQDYTKLAPKGMNLLQERVNRRFLPYDDTWFPWDDARAYSTESTIADVVQESMQRHASGMSFIEANAGPQLDSQMKPEGFQIDLYVDWKTGILFGGNQFNCGTWMDKMGESEKAGSKGIPGTPRDGAAIEITGMLYSTLIWLAELHRTGEFKHRGVTIGKEVMTYRDWAVLLKNNFEHCYYIPRTLEEDGQYDINSSVVNRRGIYKDLYRSGKEYEDYQLRPNFPIAMTVAPDLFEPEKALFALSMADKFLRGPIGMATLDPSDFNYRPDYINSDDSDDFHTAKGRNYHQGPEWVWPTGFFLRALLKFDLMRRKSAEERVESFQQVTWRLSGCVKAIEENPWAGLTELTNKSGSLCADSCPTQAWSAGCLIDLFQDTQMIAS